MAAYLHVRMLHMHMQTRRQVSRRAADPQHIREKVAVPKVSSRAEVTAGAINQKRQMELKER